MISLSVHFNLDFCCPFVSGTICVPFEVFSIDLSSLCCDVLFAICILCDLFLFSSIYINLELTKILRLRSIFFFLLIMYVEYVLYTTPYLDKYGYN